MSLFDDLKNEAHFPRKEIAYSSTHSAHPLGDIVKLYPPNSQWISKELACKKIAK